MTINELDIVYQGFIDSANLLREGKPKGIRYLHRALNAFCYFSEDPNVILFVHVFGSLDADFFSRQYKKKDGEEFLNSIADILEKTANSWRDKKERELFNNLKQFAVLVNSRAKIEPSFEDISE